MKLNNTSQYAINIMLAITKHEGQKLLNAKKISEEFEIPYKYLTRIMPQLVDAKLILSTKGREGGYVLAKEAESIYIVEILNAVKSSLHDNTCILKIKKCNASTKCALHDKWLAPKEEMIKMFYETNLTELARSPLN